MYENLMVLADQHMTTTKY